jgi:hypothetical protein
MRAPYVYGIALSLLLLGCRSGSGAPDSGPDAEAGPSPDGQLTCSPPLAASGSRCVARLDECPDDQVPIIGGGCRRIGVEECAGGLKAPPGWECQRVGPLSCPGGWTTSSDGWCEPVLPPAACPAGTREVIGAASCQPIGDCGSGTYGKIAVTAATVFVDASSTATSPDGTQASPFLTIGEALTLMTAAHIAVAAGEYKEDLVLSRKVLLEGRCAEMVKITGQSAASTITVSADGVQLRGLTVGGAQRGLAAQAAGLAVERVVISGTGKEGIVVTGKGDATTISESLIAGCKPTGITVTGAVAILDHTVIRGTLPTAGASFTAGLSATGSNVTIRDSVVIDNQSIGLAASGSTIAVERSLVRNSFTTSSSGLSAGIFLQPGVIATLEDTLVDSSTRNGMVVLDSVLKLQGSAVTRTRALPVSNKYGEGIILSRGSSVPKLELTQSIVAQNRITGIFLDRAEATLTRSVVRDTQPSAVNQGRGEGLRTVGSTTEPSKVIMEDCIVTGNHTTGVSVAVGSTELRRTLIKDNLVQPSDGMFGEGVYLEGAGKASSTITVEDCTFSGNHAFSIGLLDAAATITRTLIRDTSPDQDGSFGVGLALASSDASALTMQDSLVAHSFTVGLAFAGTAEASLRGCRILDTKADTTGGYGDGIQVSETGQLDLADSEISRSARAGVLFAGGKGQVKRSAFRHGLFGIDLEESASPELADDLLYQDNKKDLGSGNSLAPAPPPIGPK